MSDAFGPDITAAAPDALAEKALGDRGAMAMLAVLAGVFIAFGSVAFLVAQAIPAAPDGPVQLLSGLVFSVGLILTILTGAELFTGNTLFVLPVMRGKLAAGRMLAAWALVWIGNLAGSLIVAGLFVAAGGGEGVDRAVAQAAVEVATGKVAKDAGTLIASGILANLLVCLAVWTTLGATTVASKILAIVGPVTIFVAAGFEHSIANQSLLPIGWLLQPGDAIGVAAIAHNLAFSTIGNVIGGAAVALAFGYAHPAR